MAKKFMGLAIAVLLLFSMAGLSACNLTDLAAYKITAKTGLDDYAQEKGECNYCEDNWAAILGIVAGGKTAVDEATNKTAVNTAVTSTKQEIDAVPKEGGMQQFPSVLENFELSDFTEEFFEDNTLFLVPLNHGYLLYDYVEFYAVSTKNGKLNFLVEVTDPLGGGDEAIDMRVFVVCISNELLEKYEIGERIKFNTYDYSAGNLYTPPFELPPLNNRDWLAEIRENSVEHRVGLLSRDNFKSISNSIITVSSSQALNELLA